MGVRVARRKDAILQRGKTTGANILQLHWLGPSYLVLHILFYNFLYQYISQGLEINCKLLVLFSLFLFFYQQLEEGLHARAMLAAFSETQSSSRRIPDISEPGFSVAASGGIGTHPPGRQLEKYKNVKEKAVQRVMSGCLGTANNPSGSQPVSMAEQLLQITVASSRWKTRYHLKIETYF